MKHQRCKQAVTLIEVLIVMVIAGILLSAIGLALRPSLIRKSYDTEAIVGLKNWYNAYSLYRIDNDDKEPRNFWHFLSYNPGAPWDMPKSRFNPGCAGSGFFYNRVHPVPHFEHRADMINRYDPEKESVIQAEHRCRVQEGEIIYYVWSPKYQRVIRQSRQSILAPGVMQGGNVKWVQHLTPFDAEMNLLMAREPRIP